MVERVLSDHSLVAERDPVRHIQPAFQEALERGASGDNYDVEELIELLMAYAAPPHIVPWLT